MNIYDIKELVKELGDTIKFKNLLDEESRIEILVAIGKDGKMIILDETLKPKKKPGKKPKAKSTGTRGRPPKNLDYIPGSNSEDFLKNDSITTEDEKVFAKELDELEETRQKILRRECLRITTKRLIISLRFFNEI